MKYFKIFEKRYNGEVEMKSIARVLEEYTLTISRGNDDQELRKMAKIEELRSESYQYKIGREDREIGGLNSAPATKEEFTNLLNRKINKAKEELESYRNSIVTKENELAELKELKRKIDAENESAQ